MTNDDRAGKIPLVYHRTKSELMAAALAELDQLASLAPNWDSYGSDPPTEPARTIGRSILDLVAHKFGDVAGAATEPCTVAALPGSGVLLEWRGESASLEVDIGPGGEIGYLFVDRRGGARRAEEADAVSLATGISHLSAVLSPKP